MKPSSVVFGQQNKHRYERFTPRKFPGFQKVFYWTDLLIARLMSFEPLWQDAILDQQFFLQG